MIYKLDEGVYGKVIKKSPIFANQTDENGNRKKVAVDNEEIISFYFDIDKEVVAFFTTNRFGYSEFCQRVLLELITKSINLVYTEENYNFEVSLINNNLDMKEIEHSLKELGALEEITIDIIPPNPNDRLLSGMQNNIDKMRLKDYKNGNITGRRSSLKSASKTGIVVESQIVKEELSAVYRYLPGCYTRRSNKEGLCYYRSEKYRRKNFLNK